MTVTLSSGQTEYQFYPSHVPYDSIDELAKALLKVVDGCPEAVVRWNDEPLEHELRFSLDGERTALKLFKIIDSVTAGRVHEEVFSFGGSRHEVVRPFWKALREMESRQSHEEYEARWREPFPEREVSELTRKVRALRQPESELS